MGLVGEEVRVEIEGELDRAVTKLVTDLLDIGTSFNQLRGEIVTERVQPISSMDSCLPKETGNGVRVNGGVDCKRRSKSDPPLGLGRS